MIQNQGSMVFIPIMENQMEKKTDKEMDAVSVKGLCRGCVA